MQLSTYTLFQLIPRMDTLQSDEESIKQYKAAVGNEDAERGRVEQIQTGIAPTSELLKTMEEKVVGHRSDPHKYLAQTLSF